MPQISVIVPVYKVESYLARCVDSILAQTFTNFELILVDDGSPDNCPVLCDEYARKDLRIVVIHQKNGGLSSARNAGIDWVFSNSDSQWISFIDSDDWVHPQYLEALYQGAMQLELPVSCCGFQRVKEGTAPDCVECYSVSCRNTADVYQSKNGCGIDAYAWRFLYHRKLFGDIRYPVGKLWEDVSTTHKLIFQSELIAEIEADLYFYFYRDNSIAHNTWRIQHLDVIDAYHSNILYFKTYPSQKLLKCIVLGYLTAIFTQYTNMNKSELPEAEKCKMGKVLRKKMRVGLRQYRKKADIHIRTHSWLYGVCYPRLVKLYWVVYAVQGKIARWFYS